MKGCFAPAVLAFLLLFGGTAATAEIGNTLHNLTPGGPGTVKNPGPVGMCAFCHTPHRATQTRALWNRRLPDNVYDLYESSTLQATTGQPTGASRLCLSCHDGTIAVGDVVHDPDGNIDLLGTLEGRVLLGTDLADDHPVSFQFDDALAAANGELHPPTGLTGPVQLDENGEVQCTACHDPHEDRFPKFLVTDNRGAALCVECHDKIGWNGSSHASSSATWNGTGVDPWPGSDFATVADNACLSCHAPHSAAQPERLLARAPLEDVCLACHNANVARTDLTVPLEAISHHPIIETSGLHDPTEDPVSMPRHVACLDCHNPHSVTAAVAEPPDVSGRQRNVRGIDLSGLPSEPAQFAYEVCFKCHGLNEAPNPRVVRLDHVTNVRLEIHSGNPSYHPVTAIGTNPNVASLIPPLSPASMIYCHDCHNSSEATSPGPSTALGPHGSDNEPILERAYPLLDFQRESNETYAMCFKCHDRDAVLDDIPFLHDRHVDNEDAPCAACHDPHGSRSSTHLINFLRFDASGQEVVRPSVNTGLLEFRDQGEGRGQCYLNCHGEEHDPKSYIGNDDN